MLQAHLIDALKSSHDAINLMHGIPNGSPCIDKGIYLNNSSDISNLLLVSTSRPESFRNSTDLSTADNSPINSGSPSNASASQVESARKNLFAVPPADCTDDTAYLYPYLADSPVEPMPTLDHVRSYVKMFTNTECITGASTKDHMIPCELCDRQVKLRSVDPSVLLEDFTDNLLVDPALLQCDTSSEELGTGSYAKVTIASCCMIQSCFVIWFILHASKYCHDQKLCVIIDCENQSYRAVWHTV